MGRNYYTIRALANTTHGCVETVYSGGLFYLDTNFALKFSSPIAASRHALRIFAVVNYPCDRFDYPYIVGPDGERYSILTGK